MRPISGSSQSGRSAPKPMRRDAERDDDRSMAERVQRAEADRLPLAGQDPGPADRRAQCERWRSGRAARARHRAPGPRRGRRGRAAWPPMPTMLARMRGLRHARGGGRARDVGDRRDVVPIDAVADPEERAPVSRTPRSPAAAAVADGGGDERFHDAWLLVWVWLQRVSEPGPYRNTLHYCAVMRPSTYTSSDVARWIDSVAAVRRDWADVRDRLHARGLRWTPQRRTLIEVLSRTEGHVTGRRAGRAMPRGGSGHDPVDGLSHARRARGARSRQPQPRRRRSGGVPRAAGGGPRPPPLQGLRDGVGDPADEAAMLVEALERRRRVRRST